MPGIPWIWALVFFVLVHFPTHVGNVSGRGGGWLNLLLDFMTCQPFYPAYYFRDFMRKDNAPVPIQTGIWPTKRRVSVLDGGIARILQLVCQFTLEICQLTNFIPVHGYLRASYLRTMGVGRGTFQWNCLGNVTVGHGFLGIVIYLTRKRRRVGGK